MFKFTKASASKIILLVLLASLQLLLINGCSSAEQKEYDEGRLEIERGHFRIAVAHFEKVIIRKPDSELANKSAREAARISFYEIQDFKKAADFYQDLILSSKSADERMAAQKQIVSVYFDHLNDYPKAVIEINKLVSMITDPKEKSEYKMKLARAYYYQNNFAQAENEVDEFLRSNPPEDQKFDMIFLKGNIRLAQKDMPKAIEIFKQLMQQFPERSIKDNVGLTLSVCYEEIKDFKNAIATLEIVKAHHPIPEYIEVRIQRLQARIKNQPASNGKERK